MDMGADATQAGATLMAMAMEAEAVPETGWEMDPAGTAPFKAPATHQPGGAWSSPTTRLGEPNACSAVQAASVDTSAASTDEEFE